MSLLTDTQLDALQEILNIGVGRSAALLSEMLGVHITLRVPVIKVLPQSEVQQALAQYLGVEQVAAVRLGFSGSFKGVAHLVFPPLSAARLVAAVMAEDLEPTENLDVIKSGALTEVGNVVLNGVMGQISNLLHQQLRYAIPAYTEIAVAYLLEPEEIDNDSTILLAQANFVIDRLPITGDIIIIFSVTSIHALLDAIEEVLEVDCG